MSDNQNQPISNQGNYNYQEVEAFYKQLLVSKEVAKGMSPEMSEALHHRYEGFSDSAMTANDVDAISNEAKSDAGWAKGASHLPFVKAVSDSVMHTIGKGAGKVDKYYSAAQSFVEMKHNNDEGDVTGGIKESLGTAGNIAKLAELDPAATWAKMAGNAIGLQQGVEQDDRFKILKEGGKLVGEAVSSEIIKTGADLVGDYKNLKEGMKTIKEGHEFKDEMDKRVDTGSDQVKDMIANANAKTDAMREDVSNLISISKTGSHAEIDKVMSEIESRYPGIGEKISKDEIATEANAFREQVVKYAGTSSYKISDDELNAYRSYKDPSENISFIENVSPNEAVTGWDTETKEEYLPGESAIENLSPIETETGWDTETEEEYLPEESTVENVSEMTDETETGWDKEIEEEYLPEESTIEDVIEMTDETETGWDTEIEEEYLPEESTIEDEIEMTDEIETGWDTEIEEEYLPEESLIEDLYEMTNETVIDNNESNIETDTYGPALIDNDAHNSLGNIADAGLNKSELNTDNTVSNYDYDLSNIGSNTLYRIDDYGGSNDYGLSDYGKASDYGISDTGSSTDYGTTETVKSSDYSGSSDPVSDPNAPNI